MQLYCITPTVSDGVWAALAEEGAYYADRTQNQTNCKNDFLCPKGGRDLLYGGKGAQNCGGCAKGAEPKERGKKQ